MVLFFFILLNERSCWFVEREVVMADGNGAAPRKVVWKIPSTVVEFKPVKIPEPTPLTVDSVVPLKEPTKTTPKYDPPAESKKQRKRDRQKAAALLRQNQPTRTLAELKEEKETSKVSAVQPKTTPVRWPRPSDWPMKPPKDEDDEFDEPPSPETIRMNKIREELYRPEIDLTNARLVRITASMELESEVVKLRVRPVKGVDEFLPEIVKFLGILSELPDYLDLLDELDPTLVTEQEKREELKGISCKSIVTLKYDDLDYSEELVYSDNIANELRGIPWDRFWTLDVVHADDRLYRMGYYNSYSAWHCPCCQSIATSMIYTSFNSMIFSYIGNIYLGGKAFSPYVRSIGSRVPDEKKLIDYLSLPTYFNGFLGLHLKLFHTQENLKSTLSGADRSRKRECKEENLKGTDEIKESRIHEVPYEFSRRAYLDKIYGAKSGSLMVKREPAEDHLEFTWLSWRSRREHGLGLSLLGKLDRPIAIHPLCQDHICKGSVKFPKKESFFACDLTMDTLIRERLPCSEFGRCPKDSPIVRFTLKSISGRDKDQKVVYRCCGFHEERMRKEIELKVERKAELKREKAWISSKLVLWERDDNDHL